MACEGQKKSYLHVIKINGKNVHECFALGGPCHLILPTNLCSLIAKKLSIINVAFCCNQPIINQYHI